MAFKIESVELGEIIVVTPQVHGDTRGFFMESYRSDQFRALGLPTNFVQDNHSRSKQDVLRGLHFQWNPPMGKLMRVTRGAAFLVAVDIRKNSPTLGQWFGLEVSEENRKQVWAPYGFARGFCSLAEVCEVQYKTTGHYNQAGEGVINVGDPEIGIKWPIDITSAQMSERDRHAPSLEQWLSSPQAEKVSYTPAGKALPLIYTDEH